MTKAGDQTAGPVSAAGEAPLNHLLRSIAPAERGRLSSELRREHLLKGRTLYRPGDLAERLFFPEDALLSISAKLRSGALVETNVVGREGAIGMMEAAARGVMASHVRVHSAGAAWCVSASAFRAATALNAALQAAARRHVEDLVAELRQSVICHTHHSLDQRLCRWVLERQDQLGGDTICVTRACLADLLGAQRTSVSEAATRLRRRGLIRSVRAAIVVADRNGLETAACECRQTLATAREGRQAAGPHLKPRRRSTSSSISKAVGQTSMGETRQ